MSREQKESVPLTHSNENSDKRSGKAAFTNYSKRLLDFIRSKVNRIEDAEDILSEVFYQYSRINDKLNPIENTAAWLYKTARNRIINQYKKKKDEPLPASYDEDEEDFIYNEIEDIIYGEVNTPETEMLRTLFLDEIQSAISDLPKEQREVFEMTELLDFTIKEVSEETNTPVNTVLSRKHYAVKFLRKRLESLYYDVMDVSEKRKS